MPLYALVALLAALRLESVMETRVMLGGAKTTGACWTDVQASKFVEYLKSRSGQGALVSVTQFGKHRNNDAPVLCLVGTMKAMLPALILAQHPPQAEGKPYND